ncbi:hypothetical protein F4805DRAFT_458747 [Annulohypoxylon moriforme]|nr:hypothetical protein F4805DRAFT_458747 [Annulohypoxylon moriforme]
MSRALMPRVTLLHLTAFAVVSDIGLRDNSRVHDNHASLSACRVDKYTASAKKGDAPVNVLLQDGTTDSRAAIRKAKVRRELNDATAKLDQMSKKRRMKLTNQNPS